MRTGPRHASSGNHPNHEDRMRSTSLLLVALLIGAPARGAEVVLTGLQLVDPQTRTVRPASVLVRDGRIAQIAEPDRGEIPAGIPRRPVPGGWAVPAFFDASLVGQTQVSPGHRDRLEPADTALLLRAAGVGAALDLDGTRSAPGGARGAELLPAGPVLTAVGGVGSDLPGAIGLSSEEEARAAVRDLLAGPRPPVRLSVISDRGQRRPALSRAEIGAILEAAQEVPVAVYVGTWNDANDALRAGAGWLVQIPPGLPPEPVLEEVRRRRPAWTPAVSVGADFVSLMEDEALRRSPALRRALPDPMRTDYGEVKVSRSRLQDARAQNRDRLAALSTLVDAGAVLVAGSQSGGLGTAHGFSLLRELAWWGRAGVDAWTVLAGATVNGPERLGRSAGFTVGAPASFTVYDRSPVDSLGVLASPRVVFVAGEPVDPEVLAGAVQHRLTEDIPRNPLPWDSRWSLIVVTVAVFAFLLVLRQLVKRAAAS